MSKRKKIKVRHLYEYWLAYFQQHIRLKRSSWRTIGHALADWVLDDATEAKRYKELETLGKSLNDVRSYALTKMRKNDIEICLKGETRIEEMSVDPKDIPENDRREIRRGQQGILATDEKCYGLNHDKRAEYGWLLEANVKRIQKRLLLGGNDVDVNVKQLP